MKNQERMDIDAREEIAKIKQSVQQFDNFSVSLVRVTENTEYNKKDDLILFYDEINDSQYYLLDEAERQEALADPEKYVRCAAYDWCNTNDGDLLMFERMAWEFDNESDYEVGADHEGPCRILVSTQYYGPYTQREIYKNGDMHEKIFSNCAEAQECIEMLQSGNVYLDHNQSSAPTYTIVE